MGPRHNEYFTVVFRGDISKVPGNPLRLQTPFGEVVATSVGHAFQEIDCLENVPQAPAPQAEPLPSQPAERDDRRAKLKPCPFCGGDAVILPNGGMVRCVSCGAEAFGPKWNTRALLPAPQPQLSCNASLKPDDGFERYGVDNPAQSVCDFEDLTINDGTIKDLLAHHLPSGEDCLVVGEFVSGELCAFKVLLKGTVLTDVKIVPRHVLSFRLLPPNSEAEAAFPPAQASQAACGRCQGSGEVSTPAPQALSAAAADVLLERQRQIETEGWSPSHDDEHIDGQLCRAAACYVSSADGFSMPFGQPPVIWPWANEWWKPSTPRRDLIKAAALILAEIERRDRAAPSVERRD